MPLSRADMAVGVVMRRTPGVTRWARWTWKPTALLPGAAPARWLELRRDGEVTDFHAATLPLTLWSSDAEAYLATLSARVPSLAVVMLPDPRPGVPAPWRLDKISASAFDAQLYSDSGDATVALVPMPPAMIAWLRDFAQRHHVPETFVKRRRDRARIDQVEDGKGDPRIRQMADVYRAPRHDPATGGPRP